MTLHKALKAIYPPSSVSTTLEFLFQGKQSWAQRANVRTSLAIAKRRLALSRTVLRGFKSDAEYWGQLAVVEYWEAVRNILLAADKVGPKKLPDIPLPQLSGTIMMNAISQVKEFGLSMLKEVERQAEVKHGH